ncbi:toll/interleukin-1 receptor domain-containing protein [Pseudarthrobacter sp. fls2-241-R2A-127]|uniref:toll/interleukin-1 receptor domain-containing protein n=1 Tax=Pseudarthrobacter sp. fls2-241-R2A-127 TaxID=3040303 RepID=UPI00255315C5|nr:toll/interleukin-1 receptor domain-containing protein [Pseudarthrobacter sp. fls2-241-R2A-127]
MQVFISWSGQQSQHVAAALRSWLPKVLDNRIKPFVSSKDIDKGDRGLNKIAEELEGSSYGIVVVTRANQDSPWINFEAGALGKSVSDSRVAPLLVGLSDTDVKGPLKQFQNSAASDKSAVFSLVRSLNKALPDPLGDGTLEVLFSAHWAEMEEAIRTAPTDGELPPKQPRKEADLLDEVLTTVRSLQRDMARIQNILKASIRADDLSVGERVGDLIRSRLKLSTMSWTESEDEITVHLPEGAPKVGLTLLRMIRDLAVDHGVKITLMRPNGSWVAYSSDGQQSRKAVTGSGFDEEAEE